MLPLTADASADEPRSGQASGSRYGDRSQRRGPALTLAIALHLIVLTLLILQKAAPPIAKMESRLKAFMLSPENDDGGDAQAEAPKPEPPEAQPSEAQESPKPPAEPVPPPEVPIPSDKPLPFIQMSGTDFAASNISKLPNHRPSAPPAADSKPAYGPGVGPNGESLYAADWYRRPSRVELSTYIPANAPRTGWGQIACRTAARYRVEDCYIMGETPRGSGFGRAVLNAAWQFQILPPRKNGQNMVGEWVSIRITYTEEKGFTP